MTSQREEFFMADIQIPMELMSKLIEYFYPDSEPEPTGYLADEIRHQIEDKVQKMTNRALFTQYKTATTPEQREKARRAYLLERGFTESFISDSEVRN